MQRSAGDKQAPARVAGKNRGALPRRFHCKGSPVSSTAAAAHVPGRGRGRVRPPRALPVRLSRVGGQEEGDRAVGGGRGQERVVLGVEGDAVHPVAVRHELKEGARPVTAAEVPATAGGRGVACGCDRLACAFSQQW